MNDMVNYQDDEIDLRDLFRTLWKWKRFIIGMVVVSTLVASVTFTVLYPKKETASISVVLSFEGIENSVYPDGRIFSNKDIISPSKLKQAVDKVRQNHPSIGDSLLVSFQEQIAVEGVIPKAIELKMKAAEKRGEVFLYSPNQVILSTEVSSSSKFEKEAAFFFLTGVIETFGEHFEGRYGEDPVTDVELTSEFLGSYDYGEIHRALVGNTSILRAYISKRIKEAGYFKSAKTGDTFQELAHKVALLDTIDIRQVGQMIENKTLTRLPDYKIDVYEIAIDKLALQHKKEIQKSQIANELLVQLANGWRDVGTPTKGIVHAGERNNTVLDSTLIDRIKADSAEAYLLRVTLESRVAASDASVDIAHYRKKINTIKAHDAGQDAQLFAARVQLKLKKINGELSVYAAKANLLNREFLDEKIRGAVQIVKAPSILVSHEKNISMLTVLVFMASLFLSVLCVFVLEAFGKGETISKKVETQYLDAA